MRWAKGVRKALFPRPTGESFEEMDDSLEKTPADDQQCSSPENRKAFETRESTGTIMLQQSLSWTGGSATSGSGSLRRANSRSSEEDSEDDIEECSSSASPLKSVVSSLQEPPVEVKNGARKNETSVFIDDDEVTYVKREDKKSFQDRFCCCFASWSRRERVLMAIIAFLGVLILILFSTNMSLVSNSRSALRSPEVSAAQSVECGDVAGKTTVSSAPQESGSGSAGSDTNSDTTEDDNSAEGTSKNTANSTSAGSASTNGTSDGPNYFVPSSESPYPPNIFEEESSSSVAEPGGCGCEKCTTDVWNIQAGEFTCGDRISFLYNDMREQYPTQQQACRRIAFEYPCQCGSCDPGRCGLPTPEFSLPDNWKPLTGFVPAPTPVPVYTDPSLNQGDQTLYCYPAPEQRATYTLWGGMVLQIKEDASTLCGPGNNSFGRDTVLIDTVADTLTLQYKNGMASEVRVLLPEEQRPYTYGTYSFSVQSVSVKNSAGEVKSGVLPKELVLGMFTWDDTENYATHENYNHEVDIEISRWDCETNSDLQFLVQPPGFPQMHRLFTGDPDGDETTKYQQGGQVYSFAWEPAEITWETTAGNSVNNNFVLKTEEAVYRDVEDYVQCLEDVGGNMEVRLNLWNMLGNATPLGLDSTDVVEVVFDNFSFTPSSGVGHLEEGGICSKNCQCEANVSQCIDNICTAIA